MKSEHKQPLLIAYIAFLVLSVIYSSLSKVLGFEFPAWERIVVAATIASYAFSIAYWPKFLSKTKQTYNNILKEYLELAKNLHETEKKCLVESPDKEALLTDGKGILQKTTNLIKRNEESISKNEKIIFWCCFFGYYLFFCILSFDSVFNFFAPVQDIWTLLAFIIILVVDFIESLCEKQIEETHNTLITNTKDTIKNLEDKQNGQTENAQHE